jgi:hypothetical protein
MLPAKQASLEKDMCLAASKVVEIPLNGTSGGQDGPMEDAHVLENGVMGVKIVEGVFGQENQADRKEDFPPSGPEPVPLPAFSQAAGGSPRLLLNHAANKVIRMHHPGINAHHVLVPALSLCNFGYLKKMRPLSSSPSCEKREIVLS